MNPRDRFENHNPRRYVRNEPAWKTAVRALVPAILVVLGIILLLTSFGII